MTVKQLESNSWSLSVHHPMARLSPPEISSSFLGKHADPRFLPRKRRLNWRQGVLNYACYWGVMRQSWTWYFLFVVLRLERQSLKCEVTGACQLSISPDRIASQSISPLPLEWHGRRGSDNKPLCSPRSVCDPWHCSSVFLGLTARWRLFDIFIIMRLSRLVCSKYFHPFEFRLTRFYTRRLSHLFTFHSQGGLSLRPTFPCVQNSKFTGKVCFYVGFVTISFAISFGGYNVSAVAGKLTLTRVPARVVNANTRSLILEESVLFTVL